MFHLFGFFLHFNSLCLFVCLSTLPCQLTFLHPEEGEKKQQPISRTLTFLYRGGTNSTYKMPPTPFRQIYSKICVCLEHPRLSGSRPPLPRKCHGVMTTSATAVRWVTLGRRRGGLSPPPTPDPDRCHIPPPWAPSVSCSPFSILQR